jgi:hypothetical protein
VSQFEVALRSGMVPHRDLAYLSDEIVALDIGRSTHEFSLTPLICIRASSTLQNPSGLLSQVRAVSV